MGFESYISESEAASLAGVGVTTLRRFAEAGYFKIETESDGLKLYARSDLERVFGLKSKPAPAAPVQSFPQFTPAPQSFQAWSPPKETISPESNGAPVSSAVAAAEPQTVEEITLAVTPAVTPVESSPEPTDISVTPVVAVQAPIEPAVKQPLPQVAAIEVLDRSSTSSARSQRCMNGCSICEKMRFEASRKSVIG